MARELWHPAWCDTRLHQINYHFRQGSQDKYAYDFETLAKVLADAGFVQVTRREFDPALDAENRRRGTLYVDGFKPSHGASMIGETSSTGDGRVPRQPDR